MATQQTAPVVFLKAGDHTYKLAKLTIAQQEELAEYLRFAYVSEHKKYVEGLPQPLADSILTKATIRADDIYPGKKSHASHFYTNRGLSYCLHLASQKYNPLTQEQAYGVLDLIDADGITVIGTMAGFLPNPTGKKATDEAMQIREMIHQLVNAPHYYTVEEAKSLSLDDIELIFCDPKAPAPHYSQKDQEALIARSIAKQQKKQMGIWGEDEIWH